MFKLLIECSRDIDSINIQFSDGKPCVMATPRPEGPETPQRAERPETPERPEDPRYSLLEEGRRTAKRPLAKAGTLPEIPETDNREPKVSENLQNLDL